MLELRRPWESVPFLGPIRYDFNVENEYVPGYDAAVLPVLAWVSSNEWLEQYMAYGEVFYHDLGEVLGEPIPDLLTLLPTPFWARAARCSFDDFITIKFQDIGNVLDQYLDESKGDLPDADVDFLLAFRHSVVRVYYVEDRVPDEHVLLRDLSGGTTPIRIQDDASTAALSAGDKIASRVVRVNDKDYLAGALLALDDLTLEVFKEIFEATFKEEMHKVEKYLQKEQRQKNLVRQRLQKGAARMLSSMWAAHILEGLEEMPPLAGEDDPETLFQATILYSSKLQPIVDQLDAHPDLDRTLAKEFFWLWHTDRTDPMASLKAIVWISGDCICLESCERSRLEEAAGILAGLLGDSLEEAEIWEVESDFDEEDEEEWEVPEPGDDEDESAFRQRVHLFLQHDLIESLKHPLEQLNGKVPRDLAKTAKGRKQLSKWLATVEADMLENMAKIGIADYDMKWLWEELGMESYRQSGLF